MYLCTLLDNDVKPELDCSELHAIPYYFLTRTLRLGCGRKGIYTHYFMQPRMDIIKDPGYGRGVPFWAFYFSG